MNEGALRALEFDRIASVVRGLAVTPTGERRLAELHPLTDPHAVDAAQQATTEGTRFLADHPGFPLRAPANLEDVLDALGVEGRALEADRLVALADYLASVDETRGLVTKVAAAFPILATVAHAIASFRAEIADVRRKIDPAGQVADDASPALAAIRERLRKHRARLRSTLESFLRGRDTAKYLQDQVITDRNGRYVLVVRAEHRQAIPGIVHGASASGASLFLEPLATVDINNDIVALEEQEADEVRRILVALTDAFRSRSGDLRSSVEAATELDVIQARARFSQIVGGTEPALAADGTFELRGARHPLLMRSVKDRLADTPETRNDAGPDNPVPVDIVIVPPVRVLVVTGPNTGGKTVALKTAGLLAAMAQAGLHVPAEPGSRLPLFKSLFADIGDEQSISASLSTFSAHIANVVSMNRDLALPALILLDEVGAGTDPVEGGALGTAIIDHFRQRGAHLIATTHYDSLKSYASTTEGVVSAAFGFDPETFAPTYRLVYGTPGRSLAIEIAARLGLPAPVIAAARGNLTDPEKQLAEHLARIDHDLRALEAERQAVARERSAVADTQQNLRSREEAVRAREETARRRLHAKLDDQVREARREIEAIIDGLKTRSAELAEEAARRAAAKISTGEAGAARAAAQTAVDEVVTRLKQATDAWPVTAAPAHPSGGPAPRLAPGVKVAVGTLGLEGVVVDVRGKHAEVDVRGKRLRAALRDLRVIGAAPKAANVRVSVGLTPRESGSGGVAAAGSLTELNVIGCTVDEAIDRTDKFLDQSTVTDQRTVRIVHGHGTGQLRRGIAEFLKHHPLVARFEPAPPEQGGAGATVVELKD